MWPQSNEYVAERLAGERRDRDQEAARLHRLMQRIEQARHNRSTTSRSERMRRLLHELALRVASARI